MSTDNDKNPNSKPDPWHAVKSFAAIIFVLVAAYKIAVTPFNFVLDFPTLLSLLLAFFSVGLAALFYFKATETSNTFYDNTYKFTRELAQLITKMESGFGERLKHLDEGYSSMRDHIQRMPNGEKLKDAQKKIEEGEETIDKTSEERNALIMQLLEKAHLQEEEKAKFITELKGKEEQLDRAREEMARLKRRMTISRMKSPDGETHSLLDEPGFIGYTQSHVLDRIWKAGSVVSKQTLRRRFSDIFETLDKSYVSDLRRWDIVDENNELTDFGANYMRRIRSVDSDTL